MLDAAEDILIEDVIPDGMRGAGSGAFPIHPVCIAVKVAVGNFLRRLEQRHVLSAVSAFQKTGKDLDRLILHGPASIGDLFLNLLEHIFVDDGLMCKSIR